MKNRLLLILLLSFVFIQQTIAQSKFGYVNSQEILNLMPGMKNVEIQLQEFQKDLETEYNTQLSEFEKLSGELNKMIKDGASETLLNLKKDEVYKKQEMIQKLQQAYESELMEKEQLLLKPLLTELQKAINEVAKEKSINYVFDLSQGTLLFVTESDNISMDVKQKLGIKSDNTN